ncbi:tannase/feruloyl esterase family alpha/beta hydrolase [Acidipila sp. EB88]|uniref:tannase/feruloyl esterase family alpha/beta hydrolase n=1 Tax=Acidipila sp. EB88 TaxID=2305226 RepID=UPI001F23320D|nr:tannase/feruloyl esterase family alpha/beta hydrolase [Acidipila sp. EB88]
MIFLSAAHAALGADCASLAKAALPGTTIQSAEMVTAGTLKTPDGEDLTGLPAFCRVRGMLRPSEDSAIRFEVWMPANDWNHRLLGTGNGGFAGSIYYGQMAGVLKRGFATAGTDTGHQAEAEDASWAYRHPEKVKDFGYRGLHLTTETAKAMVNRFYGQSEQKAYFDGCSDGGREALMEAQRYPADYDGILAGAPANDWSHMLSAGLDVSRTVNSDPAGYISSLKLPAITRAVLAHCDAQDGLKDGILNDPRTCAFKPETLLCTGEDSLECLTAPQVRSLKKLYAGGSDSKGRLLFPGQMPGDEAGAWKDWITGSGPGVSNYVQGYFRYMVESDPSWNALTADLDTAAAKAETETAEALDATNPDLAAFVKRGGKLILYHGWNDPAISPLNTIHYYGQVQQATAGVDAAVRLYMAPGMTHCVGGPGPSALGQLGIQTTGSEPWGLFAALEGWVESGTRPGAVIATKYGPEKKPVMTRPVCPFPQEARYQGSGDPDSAGSFACGAAEAGR